MRASEQIKRLQKIEQLIALLGARLDQLKRPHCFVVFVETGDYDSYERSVDSIWFNKAQAEAYASEARASQKHRRLNNRQYYEVEYFEIKGKP